ncbi:MAG: hypothetical protein GY954_10890 [Alteromonas sp.]|nr:hypothetical protein [Alteromonas sp.]MCP3865744.1 hypothetical protein [Aestuariibacter sp.]MCP4275815.1 hypothetical protein [Gammaproteobacteria bacterium]MCP4526532.1 hypothetical protein [Aestuariibacter sp.]|tara:strand:- start:586 stop:795 length:210 start_codon:yes stop_codon:yes gene_type:complete
MNTNDTELAHQLSFGGLFLFTLLLIMSFIKGKGTKRTTGDTQSGGFWDASAGSVSDSSCGSDGGGGGDC